MSQSRPDFAPFRAMMTADGQPAAAIDAFESAWIRLVNGDTGMIPECSIVPATAVPGIDVAQPFAEAGRGALAELAVIRLNGGLGTSMGLDRAKSLLPARNGKAFLTLIAEQVETLRATTKAAVPLVLMDSFRTRADALPLLAGRPGFIEAQAPVPASFLQHKVPKVLAADFSPAPAGPWNDEHRFCPPGHGDIFAALQTSGTLAALLGAGIRHAFVANADNLGATPDPAIYGWMRHHRIPFLMEVCRRTAADAKGGHLAVDAQDHSGRFMLREVAQCPPEDIAAFQDIDRHRYFNTNNLWIDLEAVAERIAATGCRLPLPLIRNTKHLDPTDPATPVVFQLEAAMGAAIAIFDGATAIEVPRSRFLPVKTVSDLLRLRSDLYIDHADGSVVAAPGCNPTAVTIRLDQHFYSHIQDFEARFPKGPPSLAHATSLTIVGDVRFGAHVVIRGSVTVNAPAGETLTIPDDTVLEGP